MLNVYVNKNAGSKNLQTFKEKTMIPVQRGRLTAFSYRTSRLKKQNKTKMTGRSSKKRRWLHNLSSRALLRVERDMLPHGSGTADVHQDSVCYLIRTYRSPVWNPGLHQTRSAPNLGLYLTYLNI